MKKFSCFFVVYIMVVSAVFARDMRFVQITDARYSKADENNTLSKVIEDINNQKDIDFVVFTGDNIQKPSMDNLENFVKEAKKLKYPFYVVIGDKDVNKHKDLSKKQYAHYLKKKLRTYRHIDTNYVFEKNGLVFMVVDGAKDVIPSTNGYFKEDVLEWVDANLELYSGKNVVILQHFPLIPPIDKETYITLKPEKYLSILEKHSNVKAVISGHFGINKEQTVNGIIHISTAPIPNYRIIDILDCNSSNPTIWAEVREVK